MARRDVPREIRDLYFPTDRTPVLVDVPPMKYLMVDGSGNPNSSKPFREAIEALYGLAYTLKFGSKDPRIRQAPVMPLEGRFWSARGARLPARPTEDWRWTLMVREPDAVRKDEFRAACRRLRLKKNPAALGRVRLERWKEGKAAQALYVGPYSGESTAIRGLETFARRTGYRFAGRHHEIYLSNPQRTRPGRLKTVLRHPVSRARRPGRGSR